MKKYFLIGNIQYGYEEVPKIEIGNLICYDKKNEEINGRFKTLYQFIEWLSECFEYKPIVGENYQNSVCLYEILSIKSRLPLIERFRQLFSNTTVLICDKNYCRTIRINHYA